MLLCISDLILTGSKKKLPTHLDFNDVRNSENYQGHFYGLDRREVETDTDWHYNSTFEGKGSNSLFYFVFNIFYF